MNIEFEDPALEELYLTGKTHDKKYRGLQFPLIKQYVKCIDKLMVAEKIEDLFFDVGLNYERLKGSNIESVRINNQYRLIFQSNYSTNRIIISTLFIIKISKHYE